MPNAGFWVAGLVVTADRANAGLMQTGAEGDFDSSQTGLTFLETATGKIKRATGAGWEVLVDKDPAAAVGGLRTLGTGSLQAAVGNHTHTDVQEWLVAGSYPGGWTKPSGATRVLVQVWAPGGGAGGMPAAAGGAGGGGGGGHIEAMFEASEVGATENTVVGAAGVGGLGGADGTDGGDSSFGSGSTLVTATGGKKSLQGPSSAGGLGGIPGGSVGGNGAAATGNGSNGVSAVVGSGGGGGGCAGGWTPGNGGSSTLSGVGGPGQAQGHGGNGQTPGGGGGGAGSSGGLTNGGDGGIGRVRVVTYLNMNIPPALP